VISVCNLACAARFRANAGPKSVGMIGRPHAHPSCAGTTPTGPLQFPLEMKRALNQGLIALLDLDWAAIPIPRSPWPLIEATNEPLSAYLSALVASRSRPTFTEQSLPGRSKTITKLCDSTLMQNKKEGRPLVPYSL
jgi:hypothetical protein